MNNIIPRIRLLLYKICSEQFIFRLLNIYSKISFFILSSKLKKIKKIFYNAPETPEWLEWKDLIKLQRNYLSPFINSKSAGGHEFLDKKGKNKAFKLISLIKKEDFDYKRFLELGCNEGMVCYHLQSFEKEAVGIDIDEKYFEKRLIEANVPLIKMDAANLKFADNEFDFAFTFDCFEHFAKPDKVLEEAIRVVRSGGYIYIVFSLPFTSPYGMHFFKTITVPYCQFLFPIDLMKKFSKKLKRVRLLPEGDLPLNKWSTEDYRKLWKKHLDKVNIIKYNENFDLSQINLIKKYPSCFKSKTKNFDNLIVSSIEILFKKR